MMGRKGKAFTNADARKLMTSNAAMRGSMIPMNPKMLSDELMKLNEGTEFGLGPLDMKKGGRVKKTKFSTKKKKQANKMRKK
jgi:exoribonuclease R